MKFRPFGRLIPPEAALRRLMRATRPVGRTETVALADAADRLAATTLRADRPIPGTDRASWDGYALRASETRAASARHPLRLRLRGARFAEGPVGPPLRPGEAWAVATGAALPPGATAVAIFEEVERRGDFIFLTRPVRAGDRRARIGEDFARGDPLAIAGEPLTPARIGALAMFGHATVAVRARPRIAIVSNGNELVAPGARLRPGQIFESNSAALAAVVRAAGGEPVVHPPAPDDPRRLRRVLRAAARGSDLLLVTGGSSVGERDRLPEIFASEGHRLFHGIAVRPGKPTLAARVDGRLWLGLPGHPTSCLLNMFWLGLPVLRRAAGRAGPGWVEGWARMGDRAVALTEGLSTVVPLRVGPDGRVYSTFHSSSAISSLAGAEAFTLLPPGGRPVGRNDSVRVRYLLPPLGRGLPAPNG
ncbi:MAG: molybdopterin molybdotransferase MoeA [Thermoplasmata archaeon]